MFAYTRDADDDIEYDNYDDRSRYVYKYIKPIYEHASF